MAILKTRLSFKQVKAENGEILRDDAGKAFLEPMIEANAVSHIMMSNAAAGSAPGIMSAGQTADLMLGASSEVVSIFADGAEGKLKLANAGMVGPKLQANASHTADYPVIFPIELPAADAFLKIDASGQLEYSTASASTFDISDGVNSSTVYSGETVEFRAVANETTVVVGTDDSVTYGLPAEVILATSLEVPLIKSTSGNVITLGGADASFAGNIGVAADVFIGGDLGVAGSATISGDLTVNGTITYINSETVRVTDKSFVIADSAANGTEANNAGIYVGSDTAPIASFYWENAGDQWEIGAANLNLADASKTYQINDVDVLTADGALFTNAGLGDGLTIDANNLAMLKIEREEYVGSDASAVNIAPEGDFGKLEMSLGASPESTYRMVFLNGVLQREGTKAEVKSGAADVFFDEADAVSGKAVVLFDDGVLVNDDLITVHFVEDKV
jgi:hypothetical protein